MKRLTEDRCKKIVENKENKDVLNGFVSYAFNNMLFAVKESADLIVFQQGLPHIGQVKQKSAICFKTDNENDPLLDDDIA